MLRKRIIFFKNGGRTSVIETRKELALKEEIKLSRHVLTHLEIIPFANVETDGELLEAVSMTTELQVPACESEKYLRFILIDHDNPSLALLFEFILQNLAKSRQMCPKQTFLNNHNVLEDVDRKFDVATVLIHEYAFSRVRTLLQLSVGYVDTEEKYVFIVGTMLLLTPTPPTTTLL